MSKANGRAPVKTQITNGAGDPAPAIEPGLDLADASVVLRFGVDAQMRVSESADQVLARVRAKDATHIRRLLTDLMSRIDSLDVSSVERSANAAQLIIRKWVPTYRDFGARYEQTSSEVDRLIPDLNASAAQLLKDIAFFDGLYEKNQESLRQLDRCLTLGTNKLAESRESELPALQRAAEESGDPMDAEQLKDFGRQVSRLEHRLQNLQAARLIALQTAPQIRLIQNDLKILVEEIHHAVLTTVPLWKNRIVTAISLQRHGETLRLQQDVTRKTIAMLNTNSEMLCNGSLEIARQESDIDDAEMRTLEKVHRELLSTLDGTLKHGPSRESLPEAVPVTPTVEPPEESPTRLGPRSIAGVASQQRRSRARRPRATPEM